MSVLRFFAIACIIVLVSVGWMILGMTVLVRTDDLQSRSSDGMNSLWGPEYLVQASPFWSPKATDNRDQNNAIAPASSDISVDLVNDYRYKGLLWFSTFTVRMTAKYAFFAATSAPSDTQPAQADGFFVMPLPKGVTGYDGLSVSIDSKPQDIPQSCIAKGQIVLPLNQAGPHVVTVSYATGGRRAWLYAPGDSPDVQARGEEIGVTPGQQLCRLQNFQLAVATSFDEIDYPKGARSPTAPAQAAPAGKGMIAQWKYENALTSQPMGIVMPQRINAGPIAARMSLFAPITLIFFFTVLFTVVAIKRINLHPMHYLFIAAGFFSFHILMSYLVDIVNIHATFWICSAVSLLLVVSYMRLVAGVKFAVFFVGLAQLVYLVGFSYAFFWAGRTGLAITVGAVVTLFILMQVTGRIQWHEYFKRNRAALPAALPGGSTLTPPLPPQINIDHGTSAAKPGQP